MNARSRQWERYRQLAQVLVRHGFDMLVDRLELGAHLPLSARLKARLAPSPLPWPDRVRQVLVDLGPVWIKLGQLASIRGDLLPRELVEALRNLQDAVEPFPSEQALAVVEAQWQRPVHELVSDWDPLPLATASIGQVYAGRLHDGTEVVIKVRRPGIVAQAEADLEIARRLAWLAERRWTWARELEIGRLMDELVDTLREEFDFRTEARNTDRAFRALGQVPGHRVPKVMERLSGPEVLVMTRLAGIKLNDREGLVAQGLDPALAARRFVEGLYRQVFVDGFFHADPHPGNVHVDPWGSILWLDWGLAGHLSEAMRSHSARLIIAMTQGNSAGVVQALLNLSAAPSDVDRAGLLAAVDRLRRRYYDAPLEQFQLGEALMELLEVAHRFHLRIPTEYALLAKAALIADGIVRELAPTTSLLEFGRPLAGQIARQQLDPRRWAGRVPELVWSWGEEGLKLPSRIGQALDTLGRGKFVLQLEDDHLDRLLEHWGHLVARITAALLLGAMMVALGLIQGRGAVFGWSRAVLQWAFLAMLGLSSFVVVRALWRGHL